MRSGRGLATIAAILVFGFAENFTLHAQQTGNPAVDKIFDDLAKPASPGCALGVYRDGKIIYAKGYGLANIEADVAITPQTVFDIGSTSKQFTAASILLLEKQGKLSLTDDIRKYILEIPDYGHPVTILNLLNHTSGLRDYLTLMYLAGFNFDGVTTDDDALAFIARQKKLNFTPGSDWLYSNSGFFLLSVIVKRVSGKSLRDFAQENIFTPLAMSHTQFRDDHTSLIVNRALAYDPKEKGGYSLDVSYFEQTGDGAVHTSVEDLQKWDENFYSAQVGGKDFLAEIQERGKLSTGKTLDYAKGLFIGEHRGLRTVAHGGAWGGYRAELLRFPDQHFSVACLCNVENANPSKRAEEVAEVYLAGIMKPKESASAAKNPAGRPVTLTPEQLQVWAGTYRDPKTGEIWRVKVTEGKLRLDLPGRRVELHPVDAAEFEPANFPGVRLAFEPARGGAPRKLKITGAEDLTEAQGPLEAIEPPKMMAAELSAYAGNYWSDELQVTYRLAMQNGKLVLKDVLGADGFVRANRLPASDIQPVTADDFDFSGAPITIHFTRNAGHPAGFVLDAGRTRGMIFKRAAQK